MEILSDKSYRSYGYISRYSSFPYYYNNMDGKYVYGTTSQLNTEGDTYVLHKVGSNDTFDTLALQYYNNPTLYWIICDFNRIQDPYTKLKVGQQIKIPSLSNIKFKTD